MSRSHTPHKRRKPAKSAKKKRATTKRKGTKKPAKKPAAPKRKKKPARKPAAPAKKRTPAREPARTKKPARKRTAPAGFREVSGVRDMLEQIPLPFGKEARRQRVIDLAFDSGFRTEALPNSEDLYDYMHWFAEELDLEIYDVYAMYYGYTSNGGED